MLVPDMAGPDGERVKLLDFGIAKLGGQQDASLQAPTRTGQIFGTVSYMSPEQFRQGKLIDGQSDVYSLGVVMYRLVAGRLPFVSEHGEMGLAALHMFEKPPPLKEFSPEASPWLAELIDAMLRKDAKERPAMAEVAEQLQAHLPFRAPSRNSFPPGQRSRSTPAPAKEKELGETAPDLSPPLMVPSPKSEPAGNFKSSTGGPSTADSSLALDDGLGHSLTAANGQMTGSSLGRLLRRPLFIAISFGLLGVGLGGVLLPHAANSQAKAPLGTAAPLPPVAPDKAEPSAASAPNIAAAVPAKGDSLPPAPAASGQTSSAGNTAGTLAGHEADNPSEPRSHKPARRVRSSKRADGNKDGTPSPNAAGTHSTLLND